MTRYSRLNDATDVAKTRGQRVRVHYKKTREIAHFIKGMKVMAAIKYLEQVIEGERGIPMLRHTGGCGRHGVGKLNGAPGNAASFPVKPTKAVIELLRNVLANAKSTGLAATEEDLGKLKVVHIQCNRAIKSRRRTFRAHGRIAPFMQSPVHIEIIAAMNDPDAKVVEKPEGEVVRRFNRKDIAKLRKRLVAGASA